MQGDEVAASPAARSALLKFDLPLPSPAEAFELARRDLAASRQGPPPVALSVEGQGPWWQWDNQSKSLSKQELPARHLRIKSAARLANVLSLGGMPPAADLRETMLLIAWEEAGLTGSKVAEDLKPWIEAQSVAELNAMLARGRQAGVSRGCREDYGNPRRAWRCFRVGQLREFRCWGPANRVGCSIGFPQPCGEVCGFAGCDEARPRWFSLDRGASPVPVMLRRHCGTLPPAVANPWPWLAAQPALTPTSGWVAPRGGVRCFASDQRTGRSAARS